MAEPMASAGNTNAGLQKQDSPSHCLAVFQVGRKDWASHGLKRQFESFLNLFKLLISRQIPDSEWNYQQSNGITILTWLKLQK